MKKRICLIGMILILGISPSINAKSIDAGLNGPANAKGSTIQAIGTELTVNGGWVNFSWDTGTSTQVSGNPFTFSATGPVILKITDAYIDGDQFKVTVNGDVVGTTSVPTDNDDQISGDADAAFANPNWSSGRWNLGSGDYEVELEVIATASCCTGGGGFISVESAPPAIPTLQWQMLLLMALGLALLGFATIRKLHS